MACHLSSRASARVLPQSLFLNFSLSPRLRKALVLVATLSFPPFAYSQGTASLEEAPVDLTSQEITVEGAAPRKKSVHDTIPTAAVVSGLALEKKKQTSLGETLSREAGVSSSFFGPNASRPVIRGLEGERVRVLQNGVGTLDASGASPDHAVSVDPLLVEKIEIIRGSAALLYGNSAIGGVVNVQDQRIPQKRLEKPTLLLNTRGSTADWGRSAGLVARASLGEFTFHVDGTARGASNYSIPGFTRSSRLREESPLSSGENEVRGNVVNSRNSALDGSIGASWTRDSGYWGASYSQMSTLYGTVAEPDVQIDLDRYRLDLGGEEALSGAFESIRVKVAGSAYRHQELEDDAVATQFSNRATESRVDLKHAPLPRIGAQGIVGVQHQYSLLSVTGEEAFLPTTRTQQLGFFVFEEWEGEKWTPSFGLRLEHAQVQSETSERFGERESLSFLNPSVSAGLLYKFAQEWSVALQSSLTLRAPNYQELFAEGPHLATGIYERGDRGLRSEIGRGLELSLRRKSQGIQGRFTLFAQDFNQLIALTPTGENWSTEDGDTLPVYQFRPVSALLLGAEAEVSAELPWRLAKGGFEVTLTLDWVRGINRTDSENLPRMTPVRETVALAYRSSLLSVELELQRAESQGLVAQNETATDDYTWMNLGVEAPWQTPLGRLNLFGRIQNLFNTEARNHVSFLKDIAPLPGRNFILGLQARI